MTQHALNHIRVKKVDEDRQIVFGEVYAPMVIDTWGEMMTAEDIETLAHRFMELVHLNRSIDTGHDETSNGSYPIESFIARAGDPDYAEGAWVLGVKVTDTAIWDQVKKGQLNGFSFQAMVRKLPAVVELEVTRDNFGETEEVDGHTHLYFVELNDDGRVASGRTTTDAGHSHVIKSGTATEASAGHAHRFFI